MPDERKASAAYIKRHYSAMFRAHGPSSKGVDWGSDRDVEFRYRKMLDVLEGDYERPSGVPSLLDVGCGWGGLLAYCLKRKIRIDYTGLDIVPEMIAHARKAYPSGKFIRGDLFEFRPAEKFDYVVGSGVLALKLNDSIPQTARFVRDAVMAMFDLCRYGTAFNLMSNMVNFMADNLYYTSPVEFLHFCLSEISPRVKLDHGYSCLNRGRGKLYEYTVYIYKDPR
jgi:hypothetical protein